MLARLKPIQLSHKPGELDEIYIRMTNVPLTRFNQPTPHNDNLMDNWKVMDENAFNSEHLRLVFKPDRDLDETSSRVRASMSKSCVFGTKHLFSVSWLMASDP